MSNGRQQLAMYEVVYKKREGSSGRLVLSLLN
jgi:hypothetical protein